MCVHECICESEWARKIRFQSHMFNDYSCSDVNKCMFTSDRVLVKKKSKETVLPKFSLVNLCIYWGYLQKHGKGWTYRSMGDLSLKGPLQPEQWLTQAASLKLPEQLVGSSINVYPCSSDCWLLMSSQGGALCILLSFPSPVPLAYSLPSGRGHFHPEA